MAKLKVERTTVGGEIPVWIAVTLTALGGFKLDLTGLTAGQTLKAGTAVTFDEATRLVKADAVTPKGLVYADTLIEEGTSVDVVLQGYVYENRIPAIADPIKAKIPGIIFSKSK